MYVDSEKVINKLDFEYMFTILYSKTKRWNLVTLE